ncbi:cytoplasmic protein [Cryobacterium algoritolerans]|uniref:Cytoplasmic protein n=1 Tax=Cryobacterium algoritolerans TaxID=1259184 RepID=A0A4R8WKU7_9MICO|nr:cytoplasmic protein [Cryobacterium algoritolerans]TFC11132.1 cytoplasmic protein [Cryobacterium algoritolerans]
MTNDPEVTHESVPGDDPVQTNPSHYRVILENERVRVLEYLDSPGDKTTPHAHPDSVMFTLSSFSRRLSANGREVDVVLPAGEARWLAAQAHSGENTGDTETHTILFELKEPSPTRSSPAPAGAGQPLGPLGPLGPLAPE